MLERLFTYGSLQPGGQYAHLLADAGNDWQPATVNGFVDRDGWGHSVGYPALILHPKGQKIPGKVITSTTLQKLWPQLDDFEGHAYQRIKTTITLADGSEVAAYIYTLHSALQADIKRHLGLK